MADGATYSTITAKTGCSSRTIALWQRRFDLAEEKAAKQAAKAEKEAVPAGTSAYGRPMTKQA